MRTWPQAITAALVAAALCAPFAPAASAEAKYPAMEGQWRNPKMGQHGNPWDPTKPMGLGQEAPLTPEYQAVLERSLKEQTGGGLGNNYRSRCLLSGMPRVMTVAAPMEIFIRPDRTTMVFEAAYPRRIYTDGRAWPTDEAPSFEGYSIGTWIDEDGDGTYDILEAETRNFTGPRAFESTGLPLADDNQTIVKERIYLDKTDPDILHDEVTTIDHALTRPWTVLKTYVRTPNPKWVEFNCSLDNSHVEIGAETYFVSGDGKLMPTRPDQPAPDLTYFRAK